MGKHANAKLFVLQKFWILECLTDRKYFIFFPMHSGQKQRFLLLIAVEMTKIPFMGPMVIPKEECSNYFTEYQNQ